MKINETGIEDVELVKHRIANMRHHNIIIDNQNIHSDRNKKF